MKVLLARLDLLPTRTYLVVATLAYAVLRTVPAYLAVAGYLGLAALIGVVAFAWVLVLLVLAIRRRQLAVFRAAAEFTATVFGGWFLAGLATTPVRTALDPLLTLGAILLPLLAISILAFPAASLLILVGRKLTGPVAA
jgi:hypothetical protein